MKRQKMFIFCIIITIIIISFFRLDAVVTFFIDPIVTFFSILFNRLTYFKPNISHNPEDVQFWMFTSRDSFEFKVIQKGDRDSLIEAGFDPRWPIKMMIHGFSDAGVTAWTDRLRKKYFAAGNYNLITVDWRLLAKSPWFNSACKNTKVVGQETARFIIWMVEEANITSWDSIHILGSSLGAHAAGYAGRFTQGKIARITGLDPSGPLFHSVTNDDRLDKQDARFVDVIHSAGYWIGNEDLMGHVDFFPNGGKAPQPGCHGVESLDLSCSHFRAWMLYGESIDASHKNDQQDIIAIKCDSYKHFLSGVCCRGKESETAILGESVAKETKGTYFLITDSRPNFALQFKHSINCKT